MTTTNSPPADPELARTVAALRSSMREGALTRPLSVGMQRRLNSRLALLERSVWPASDGQIKHEVAKLMISFPALRGASASDAAAMACQYGEALAGVPHWALREACLDFARGAVREVNPDYAPSSARLRRHVDSYTSPVRSEALRIRKVTEATVVPPYNEKKAKDLASISTGLKQLSERLKVDEAKAHRPPKTLESSDFKAPSIADCSEIYKTRGLPGVDKQGANLASVKTDDEQVALKAVFDDRDVDRSGRATNRDVAPTGCSVSRSGGA